MSGASAATSPTAIAAVSPPPASDLDIAGIYDQYGTLAFTLAHRIVGDRGVAEDVVQDAFLTLWRNAQRYQPQRASLRTWLCTIVRNRAIDQLRGTAGRRRTDQSLDDIASLYDPADVVADVIRHDEAQSITAALAALPPAQRETIELAYYGGYTQPEIAALMARPLGTVKSRTRLALRALAASLAPLRSADLLATGQAQALGAR